MWRRLRKSGEKMSDFYGTKNDKKQYDKEKNYKERRRCGITPEKT